MKPSARRVVVGTSNHVELVGAIRAARPDLETRGNTVAGISPDDLEWANTYVGFKRPALPSMGNIRWVHCTGAGVDAWLYPVELPRNILLTRSSESFGPMIAEWAVARALAITQQLYDVAQCQARHEWSGRPIARLGGTTAVVVGTGDVGTHVGHAFRALGCKVLGVSRSGNGDPAVFSATYTVSELGEVVGVADWLIVTVPLTAATDGMISRGVLMSCRGAVLMNSGRGQVVDEAAIPDALAAGALRGAALDVFETEPLPASSPLWDDPRVIVSPHISGITTLDGAVSGFLECLDELERGITPARAIDRERGY